MPQSRTRTSRQATRAKYRKPTRRRSGSMAWNVTIAVIVIAGIAGIFLVRSGGESAGNGAPFAPNQSTGQAGSHWHTYLGVDICGEWLTPVPAFEQPVGSPSGTQNAGIHSHGDGLIHTHPFVPSEAGNNATLGKYAGYGGWSVSSDSIDAWTGPKSLPKQTSWSNGDTCPFGEFKGKPGQLVWAIDGKLRTGNPSDYHQQDGETIAIGFLPKGAKLGFPPDACAAFQNISDANNAAVVVSKNSPCQPSASTSTTTTAPNETTTTTVPPG
ncbi:MAG: hypothetical protein ACHQIG_11140 [Acidimicrobiia bacterium]